MVIEDWKVDEAIGNSIKRNLRITTDWIGDPLSSTFGVSLTFSWQGCPFTSCIIDYISKD